MKDLKTFNTYNQITKLFDVTVMTKQQINKLDNNQGFLVLTPKKHVHDVKTPRKTRDSQAPKWFRDFIINQFEPLSKKVDQINNRLTEIVQANNLIDPTSEK
ncbi:MAG: hypothetical protein ACOQNV_02540 [Mycoplasmoidaceae bacterium]